MATVFENVELGSFNDSGQLDGKLDVPVRVELSQNGSQAVLRAFNGTQMVLNFTLTNETECCRLGKQGYIVNSETNSVLFKFSSEKEYRIFNHRLKQMILKKERSVFTQRTEDASAVQYFQFYGYLSQQQNMMQDYIRTSTYQKAMIANINDFRDKVVLDVGAGSGILSFFAVQAGAKKVYAIEASSMATHCEMLVKENQLGHKILVVPGKVEEVELPEKVDVIISEPMGYMLFNERMLESYLHAKKWLKPGGKMFPSKGDLHIAPFTDEALYMEQFSKANFWYQHSFYGVDLSSLRNAAVIEYFKQPVVDTFDVRICLAKPHKYTVDFLTADETDLYTIDIPVKYVIHQSGAIHGLSFWFDVAFFGSSQDVWLSTSPTEPLTHWYQVRCLIQRPLFVQQGQTVSGRVVLRSNSRQSYDVDIELEVDGTGNKSNNSLDLKNPFFRYNGQAPQPPPGVASQSPTDQYWNNTADVQTYMINGVNGATIDASQIVQSNLIPVVNTAPINQGSIPSVISLVSQQQTTRTSIGAGISPAAFNQGQVCRQTIL
ncbi:histone-arginine methyltransferase CARM1-like isoform X2 [Tubulanus polymorphus]|uniref:histone-arginine methyltransferase CARM1-like isoform X2 n=1 Tax=Tubulanus polymorphus TaxID=672921 RepID=UPI003DA34F11